MPPQRQSLFDGESQRRRAVFQDCLTTGFSPYLEGMEVHFTAEQEAQLAQIATKSGTDLAFGEGRRVALA
jgi:hypothetical protein